MAEDTQITPPAPVDPVAPLTPPVAEPPVLAGGLNDPAKKEPDPAKPGEPKSGDDKKDPTPTGAPEKYEDFKLPEGTNLAPETLTEFQALGKELNLPQETAQKLLDFGAKAQASAVETVKEMQEKAWAEARKNWVSEIKTDPVVGGANYEKNRELAIRAVGFAQKQGVTGLEQVLNSGWGDNPAMFKVFALFGKALSEDQSVEGSFKPASMKTAAEVLYPSGK